MRQLLAQRPYHNLRLDISANNIATNSWREIEDSMPKGCTAMQVFYTGNSILKLSKGALGLEDQAANLFPIYITPGGSEELIPIEIAGNNRLSVQALDQNSTEGELVINFFG